MERKFRVTVQSLQTALTVKDAAYNMHKMLKRMLEEDEKMQYSIDELDDEGSVIRNHHVTFHMKDNVSSVNKVD